LNNISTFSSYIDVMNHMIFEGVFSRHDFKNMWTILESTTKLSCVDGKLKWYFVVVAFSNIDIWIISNYFITLKVRWKLVK
jgi:hypothetical protein